LSSLLLARGANAAPEWLEEYRAAGGYQSLAAAHAMSPDEVIERVTAAEVLGRGGAGFSAGRKWAMARAADGLPKYVVANGGEHEPGSKKDRTLVTLAPHRVLEGAAICAYATGASGIYLYLISDMAEAIASARRAIEEARAAGLLGELTVEVTLAPTTYVAGEETAALEVIEGKKAWPRKKPPFPTVAGLWGKPTTVNNVETLAVVPSLLRGEAGSLTMLATLDETVVHPGVYEVPLGTTFRALLHDFGGGTRSGAPVKAILPAMSSPFLSATHLDVPMTHAAVRAAGSNLGCGGVSVVAEGECIVERVARIAEFFKAEQCGQCPPCRMETNTIASVIDKVRTGDAGDYVAQIEKIAAFARGKGFCSLIEMAAAPVRSALALFPDDFAHHARTGSCPMSAVGG
jgi:NADH-quinone oxidoreductase subunit F